MCVCSINPERFEELANQTVELLPHESKLAWYTRSTYDENNVPKAAKGVYAQKYETLRTEAKTKLNRFTGSAKRSSTGNTTYGNSSSLYFILIINIEAKVSFEQK